MHSRDQTPGGSEISRPVLPGISVVVVFTGSERCVLECLESLMEMDYPQERLEIIAVENSDDHSIARLVSERFLSVRLLSGGSRGSDSAKQAGIDAATRELVALTDADCRVSPDWARVIAKSLTSDVDVVTGPVRHPKILTSEMIGLLDFPDSQGEKLCFTNAFPGCNVAFRRNGREVKYQVGRNMAFGSDRLISWRMHLDGYKICYNPQMEVRHFPPGDFRRFLDRRLRYGRKALLLRQIDPSLPCSALTRLGPLAAPAYVCYKSTKDIFCLMRALRHRRVDTRHVPLLLLGLLASRTLDACGIIRQQVKNDSL